MKKHELSEFGKAHHGHSSRMDGTGGSFDVALRNLFYRGSGDNREILVTAFPHRFNEMDIRLDYKKLDQPINGNVDRETDLGMVAAILGDHFADHLQPKLGYIGAVAKLSELAMEFEDAYQDTKDWGDAFIEQPDWVLGQICWDDFVVQWGRIKLNIT